MIPNHILKKDLKIYELLGERTIMARRVEKAPWKTLEPIFLRAPLALKILFLYFVSF